MSTMPNMHPSIAPLHNALAGIPELRARIIGALRDLRGPDGQAFHFDRPVTGMTYSLADIDSQLVALIALVEGLRDIDASCLVPPSYATNASQRLVELRDSLMPPLAQALDEAQSVGVQSLDAESWRLVSNSGATTEPHGHLQPIHSKMTEFADQIAPLIAIIRVGMDFSSVVAFARQQTADVHSFAERAADLAP